MFKTGYDEDYCTRFIILKYLTNVDVENVVFLFLYFSLNGTN